MYNATKCVTCFWRRYNLIFMFQRLLSYPLLFLHHIIYGYQFIGPCDATCRHRTCSTQDQIMACWRYLVNIWTNVDILWGFVAIHRGGGGISLERNQTPNAFEHNSFETISDWTSQRKKSLTCKQNKTCELSMLRTIMSCLHDRGLSYLVS